MVVMMVWVKIREGWEGLWQVGTVASVEVEMEAETVRMLEERSWEERNFMVRKDGLFW